MDGGAPAWILEGDGDPSEVAARVAADRTAVEEVPPSPYDLCDRLLVWPVVVRHAADCPAVLDALARGVAVVVRIDETLPATIAAVFRDEIQRAAEAAPAGTRAVELLSADQLQLLDALSRGLTLVAAAEQLNLAPRSASRRLAEIRQVLGVATTAEAVVLAARRGS